MSQSTTRRRKGKGEKETNTKGPKGTSSVKAPVSKEQASGRVTSRPVLENRISTSLSDAVLASSCIFCCHALTHFGSVPFAAITLLHPSRLYACFAFIILGIAAALGVIRFTGVQWIVPSHDFFSVLGRYLSVPLFGAVLYQIDAPSYREANGAFLIAIGVLLLCFILFFLVLGNFIELSTLALGATSLGYLIYVGGKAVYLSNELTHILGGACLVWGGLIYALAGLVIGVHGKIWGVPRVDLFHYALAMGNLCLVVGFDEFID